MIIIRKTLIIINSQFIVIHASGAGLMDTVKAIILLRYLTYQFRFFIGIFTNALLHYPVIKISLPL